MRRRVSPKITKLEREVLTWAMRWALSVRREAIGIEDTEFFDRQLLFQSVRALGREPRWEKLAARYEAALAESRARVGSEPFQKRARR